MLYSDEQGEKRLRYQMLLAASTVMGTMAPTRAASCTGSPIFAI